ncbi:LOW QUALITY PROTEIN: prolyl 3-hydroxylase OGFOD1-like [Melopsittacus undulatus]|uniref:LOW QUALITY PROTEIN: prolyl 3-hydroxylase OGFOD1-like n=1 Tax=Melopsittacus undulatus TaxID=13146 RepID=UPI00146A5DC5|nr:LOW QUALITY PROTEIN: prolyl 3-hydroxylase OGFOD1-like [Melopsittacus undulatus]
MGAKWCGVTTPVLEKKHRKWKVHAKLSDMALQELVAEAWAHGELFQHEVAAVEPAPFRHGVIPGFLAGTAFAEALCNELLGLSFYSRQHFQPQQTVKSLVPSWNMPVVFEVSPVSFHQARLSEVLSEKSSLSVSGWFHDPSTVRPACCVRAPLSRSLHIPFQHGILYKWIDLVYLDMNSQAQIQEEFEERSEIILKDFLKKEKYQRLCEALKSKDIQWSSRGPANKRLYETAEEDSFPDILDKILQFLPSKALFLLLSNFTGIKLHFLAPSDEDEDAREGSATDTTGNSSPKPEQE